MGCRVEDLGFRSQGLGFRIGLSMGLLWDPQTYEAPTKSSLARGLLGTLRGYLG